MATTDKHLTCRDCGAPFVFTIGEQEFFAQRGFTNEPSRCPTCRASRRAASQSGDGDGGYGRSERTRTLHPAVCSQCGKDTQVPFVPSGDKPVYCSECFEARRGSTGGRSSDRGGSSGGRRRSW